MAQSKTEEDALKRQFLREGIVAVATEVGGTSDTDFQTKAARAVIGAALNSGLVEKEARSILHAPMHATEAAERGVLVNTASSASLAMTIAIVRNRGWVAVAFYRRVFAACVLLPRTRWLGRYASARSGQYRKVRQVGVRKGESMTESKTWNTLERDYRERLEAARPYVMDGKVVEAGDTVKLFWRR